MCNDMEILSSKQEEEFKATTFITNILKFHTKDPKFFIHYQAFIWSIEILIPGGVLQGKKDRNQRHRQKS